MAPPPSEGDSSVRHKTGAAGCALIRSFSYHRHVKRNYLSLIVRGGEIVLNGGGGDD